MQTRAACCWRSGWAVLRQWRRECEKEWEASPKCSKIKRTFLSLDTRWTIISRRGAGRLRSERGARGCCPLGSGCSPHAPPRIFLMRSPACRSSVKMPPGWCRKNCVTHGDVINDPIDRQPGVLPAIVPPELGRSDDRPATHGVVGCARTCLRKPRPLACPCLVQGARRRRVSLRGSHRNALRQLGGH